MTDPTPPPGGKFLSDQQGKPSGMRLMCFLSFLTAAGIAMVDVFGYGPGSADMLELTIAFLVSAFAPKAVQSFPEHFGNR